MRFLSLMFSLLLATLFVSATPTFAALNNQNAPLVAMVDLGSVTADADIYGVYLPKKSRVVAAYLANVGNIAASDTDYFQVSLQLGSSVIAEIDSRAAHENGLTTLVPKALNVVSATSAVAAGSWLKVVYNEEGTMAFTTAKLIVVYYPL